MSVFVLGQGSPLIGTECEICFESLAIGSLFALFWKQRAADRRIQAQRSVGSAAFASFTLTASARGFLEGTAVRFIRVASFDFLSI